MAQKKFLSLIFCLIILLATHTWAQDQPNVKIWGDYSYAVADSTITIVQYTGAGGMAVIPESINGITVTAIGEYAFFEKRTLISVIIPNSITTIGSFAFNSCSNLTSISIPDSVIKIGRAAFSKCNSLTNITLGNNITNIDEYVFYDCTSLTDVIIPNKVTYLGSYAFFGCSALINATIGKKVSRIREYTFAYCDSLTDVKIPDNVTTIEDNAFRDCTDLTNIRIPDSITHIKRFAFFRCSSLTNITIPQSITSLGDAVFAGCFSLSEVSFLGNAPLMGQSVFDHCAPDFRICYTVKVKNFTSPTWYGYPATNCLCSSNSTCAEDELCEKGICIPAYELTIKHQKIRSRKLTKHKKVTLHITGTEFCNIFGDIDLDPLIWLKFSRNIKKNRLKIIAIVPAGLEPQNIQIRIGDCYGEVEISAD